MNTHEIPQALPTAKWESITNRDEVPKILEEMIGEEELNGLQPFGFKKRKIGDNSYEYEATGTKHDNEGVVHTIKFSCRKVNETEIALKTLEKETKN